MSKRWIYDTKHNVALYQDGGYIYDRRGNRKFWINQHWLYNAETSKPEYYVSGKWIYRRGGRASYYYGRTK